MKCLKCGKEFNEGIFCPECGEKYDEEAAKRREKEQAEIIEKQRIAEKEKNDVELAKAKAEQEKQAKERLEKEAELLKQKNENIRIEQELSEKKAEQEKIKAEEMTRTFNGVVYSSAAEMQNAMENFNVAEKQKMQLKKANSKSLWSMILGILTWPLTLTIVLWLPAIILSVVWGIMALKDKTDKKGFAITGLVLDGIFVLIIVISTIMAIFMG